MTSKLVVCLLMLAGCASAPVRYYTLLAPGAAAVPASAGTDFELLPVRLPQQADQKSLVLRLGSGQVELLDDAQWVAPLADDFRAALSIALMRRSGAMDVAAVSRSGLGKRVVQLSVDVQRFDMTRGGTAGLDAVWSARQPGGEALRCRVALSEPAGAGGEHELVEAQQRLLGRLADQIAAVLPVVSATEKPIVTCPSA